MSTRGDLVRKAAGLIRDRGLACGMLMDGDSFCLVGALRFACSGNPTMLTPIERMVGKRLVELGIAPIGVYWNPLVYDFVAEIDSAGVLPDRWNPAGWSNACAYRGDPDAVIHGLKLVAESFDQEDAT